MRRARVTLTGGGLAAPRLADTDTKGVFRFDRLPSGGGYKIAVQKPGFVKLDAEATPNAELKMERASAIEGVALMPLAIRLSTSSCARCSSRLRPES